MPILDERQMSPTWSPGSENAVAILTMIGQIPYGKVATYGQIARLAGIPRNSRQVGTVLRGLPSETDTPWHRVVNSQGKIAVRGSGDSEQIQKRLLKTEGVEFDDYGRICLAQFGWDVDR